MMSFALEYESKDEVTKAVSLLWHEMKITGETEVMPTDSGKWRLYVHSEKTLGQDQVKKLGGESISPKSVFTAARKKLEEE
jgi:hypothetical protein